MSQARRALDGAVAVGRAAVVIAALLVFAAAGGCGGRPTGAATGEVGRSLPDPFVDAALRARLEERGGALAEARAAATLEELAAQLGRGWCELTLPPPAGRELEMPAVYSAGLPGTLVISRVYHCDRCDTWHAPVSATAFAITAGGACATNYHVFSKVPPGHEGSFVVITDAWGRTYPVREVLAASRKDDAAIFRVDVGSDRLTPLPLRAAAAPGEPVSVLSHPGGRFYSFSPGHVSRRVMRHRGVVGDVEELSPDEPHRAAPATTDTDKLTLTLEITSHFGVGSSGGPVLDTRGNVVGMVSNTVPVFAERRKPESLQMVFHLCVPSESILKLMRTPEK